MAAGEPGERGFLGLKGEKGFAGLDGVKGEQGLCPPENLVAGQKGLCEKFVENCDI